MKTAIKKKKFLALLGILFAVVFVGFIVYRLSKPDRPSEIGPSITQTNPGDNGQSQEFNKTLHSLDDPSSIWVVVNKARPLMPKEYVPNNLVIPDVTVRSGSSAYLQKRAGDALEKMFADAKKDGLDLMLASGYRSYALQQQVYGSEVNAYGQDVADTQSARPGHSEHQTGLAADLAPASGVCVIADCFGDTAEGKWAATNAHKHGFILRYVPGKENVTGYRAEAWHFRYVGVELAKELNKQGIETLEEFFNLPGAPAYLN